MFALIRHAAYDSGTGALTEEGIFCAQQIAYVLKQQGNTWKEIHTSPSTRTKMTADIIGGILNIPVKLDDRLGMEGQIVDLLPPNEPCNNIFITHLPILTRLLRSWSNLFHINEPGMMDICSGYTIDTEQEQITSIKRLMHDSRPA